MDEVAAAVVAGSRSRLLCQLHVALLRLLQADMEESHSAHQVPHSTVSVLQLLYGVQMHECIICCKPVLPACCSWSGLRAAGACRPRRPMCWTVP